MYAHWVKARAELFELLELHPDWTKTQLVAATGMSMAWVKKWKQRRGVVLKELGLLPKTATPTPTSTSSSTTTPAPATPTRDPSSPDPNGGEPKADPTSPPEPQLV